MNTPLSWIKAYVPDLDCTPKEYMDAMTLSGTKVEGYEEFDKDLDKIIVGQIKSIEKHPDADKLVVCQVVIDDFGTTIQIVTGASNVKEGQKVPVVLDGGRVAAGHGGEKSEGGIKIKKGKLRGVESFGMMCSIQELGSSDEFYPDAVDGIYILSDNEAYKDAPVGYDAVELLGLRDANVEYEVTSNRVDCFGVIGIAREAAATFDLDFKPPVVTVKGNDEKTEDYISVEIEDTELCSRYIARVVKDIKIGPSPEWMKRRLAAMGIRPINNIVDITNYVMEEYGQPMHAYDLSTIEDAKIVVKRANKGDKFMTLDGKEYELFDDTLMICDGKKQIGIAGIMGGENSKITDDVETMLFEAACFDGTNIRLSGKKLGMRTDAQAKFEKGLDPNTTLEAINRACQLIEELGAGTVVGGMVDVYPNVREKKHLKYDPDKINALLGTDIDEDTMVAYFEKIDLEVNKENREVIVPTFRQDLLCLADLAEEVARFYGYDKIPMTLPTGQGTPGKRPYKKEVENIVKNISEQMGFCEGMTYSFESPKVYDKLLIPEDSDIRKSIVISNPLGEDYSIMRTLPENGMLTSLATNFNRRNKNVSLYEMAKVYLPKALPLKELPDEMVKLILGSYGDVDFFDMKGSVEAIVAKLNITDKLTFSSETDISWLHPGRRAVICAGGREIGYMGQVHPEVADNYDLGADTYIAVLDMDTLTDLSNFDIKYTGIAKFPASTRDISLVMDKKIFAGMVEDTITKSAGNLLENVMLFDIYEGDKIEEGKKSLAYSLRFRAKDRTLEDGEVNAIMERILQNLEKINVEIRK